MHIYIYTQIQIDVYRYTNLCVYVFSSNWSYWMLRHTYSYIHIHESAFTLYIIHKHTHTYQHTYQHTCTDIPPHPPTRIYCKSISMYIYSYRVAKIHWKLQVSFRKRATNCKALLWKIQIKIVHILRVFATLYVIL